MEPTTPTEPRYDKGKRTSREVPDPVIVIPESTRSKVDLDNLLGIVGIVATFLNLLIVVLVYMYTPI